MGYGDYHTHSSDEVAAAHIDHRHNAQDVGAAEDNHAHYPHQVGAAPEGHEHPLHQIAGAASDSDVDDLRSQGRQQWDRLTAAEDAIRALQAQNTALWAQLHDEQAANDLLRSGIVTVPALVAALRLEAEANQGHHGGQALSGLADTIERGTR
jgi:hypothetical protein